MAEQKTYPDETYDRLTPTELAVTGVENDEQYREVEVFDVGEDNFTEASYEEWDDELNCFVETDVPHGAWSLYFDPESPVKPTKGLKVRMYGLGIGHTVRGVEVQCETEESQAYGKLAEGNEIFARLSEGKGLAYLFTNDLFVARAKDYRLKQEAARVWKVLRYQTPKEAAEAHYDWSQKWKRERQEAAEKDREERDGRIALLPEVLRERMMYFHAKSPDFAWEGEDYELYIYEQAAGFASVFETVEALEEFRELGSEEQKTLLQEKLGDEFADAFTGHSGNTYGCACGFAKALLTDPESVRPPRDEDGNWDFDPKDPEPEPPVDEVEDYDEDEVEEVEDDYAYAYDDEDEVEDDDDEEPETPVEQVKRNWREVWTAVGSGDTATVARKVQRSVEIIREKNDLTTLQDTVLRQVDKVAAQLV